jgi:hypothetical protein
MAFVTYLAKSLIIPYRTLGLMEHGVETNSVDTYGKISVPIRRKPMKVKEAVHQFRNKGSHNTRARC